MRLKVYSTLMKVVGKNLIDLVVADGGTIYDVLKELSTKYGEAFTEKTGKELVEATIKYFNIFLNGKSIRLPDGMDLRLNEMDEIIILQPVGGG